jgi:hypothetical protein
MRRGLRSDPTTRSSRPWQLPVDVGRVSTRSTGGRRQREDIPVAVFAGKGGPGQTRRMVSGQGRRCGFRKERGWRLL